MCVKGALPGERCSPCSPRDPSPRPCRAGGNSPPSGRRDAHAVACHICCPPQVRTRREGRGTQHSRALHVFLRSDTEKEDRHRAAPRRIREKINKTSISSHRNNKPMPRPYRTNILAVVRKSHARPNARCASCADAKECARAVPAGGHLGHDVVEELKDDAAGRLAVDGAIKEDLRVARRCRGGKGARPRWRESRMRWSPSGWRQRAPARRRDGNTGEGRAREYLPRRETQRRGGGSPTRGSVVPSARARTEEHT